MKIVLAYSGGLDTSIILRWLKENYQAEIIAFCADIGQEEELEGLEAKALSTGASKCIIEDLREELLYRPGTWFDRAQRQAIAALGDLGKELGLTTDLGLTAAVD